MYFDSFIKSIGIQHYYGANEYGNMADFDGTWGIYDEPFLQWMIKNLNQFPQPFFSSVFTLSSHNPYRIPEKYQNQFSKGSIEIHESVGYADKSLEGFFATAAKQSWYENTLFILTADHTSKNSRPEFDNEIGQYRIPLILFHPAWDKNPSIKPKVDENQITSQIDILPTIFDFLGREIPERNYLARSIFVPEDRWALTFIDGKYHLITKERFLTYGRDQVFRIYDLKDVHETEELGLAAPERAVLENKIKAAMQYFSEGLWDNKLYYPIGR
jgi:phosphoglycerol transferase MdoB-like AlkP superfamily enzyme